MATATAGRVSVPTWQLDPDSLEHRILGEAHDDDHRARPPQGRAGDADRRP